MLVFDAYPLAAILLGEAAAGEAAADLLRGSLDDAAVSAVNAAELVDLVARARRVAGAEVADVVDRWVDGGLVIVPLGWDLGRRAGAIRSESYHRTRAPVSLADCAAIALAEQRAATLVTSDHPMLRIARALGVDVMAVPDSTGRAPG